ncbi:MAG: hypothetical protein Terrestrivirus8_20 [Terrestrivirus sp.]|uniref:Uncharacterized protein n=1 Tax=Terrestrivirus sp. TaxID=2487775 RepID=A0A3G4ZNS1_9VIRU|nr:MAG: hypothetical protein Terrestrivirus8_20 [Terrestrivirus sp.]
MPLRCVKLKNTFMKKKCLYIKILSLFIMKEIKQKKNSFRIYYGRYYI